MTEPFIFIDDVFKFLMQNINKKRKIIPWNDDENERDNRLNWDFVL